MKFRFHIDIELSGEPDGPEQSEQEAAKLARDTIAKRLSELADVQVHKLSVIANREEHCKNENNSDCECWECSTIRSAISVASVLFESKEDFGNPLVFVLALSIARGMGLQALPPFEREIALASSKSLLSIIDLEGPFTV